MKQNKKPKQTLESAQYGLEINFNLGLNVKWGIIFSSLKMLFTSNVWCSLRLLQLKTEGQTTDKQNTSPKVTELKSKFFDVNILCFFALGSTTICSYDSECNHVRQVLLLG